MLWIIIPHVAIVSSLMLAGNNPSVWQGTASRYSHELGSSTQRTSDTTQSVLGEGAKTSITSSRHRKLSTSIPLLERFRNPYKSVYRNSRYKPAWMWNRGPNKAMWIAKYAEEYTPYVDSIQAEVLGNRFGDYLWVSGSLAFILIFVPVFFGALVR